MSASPLRLQSALPGIHEPDPRPTSTDHLRDNLDTRSPEHAIVLGPALDLEARVLAAGGLHLRGNVANLSPARPPEHRRAALAGRRHTWLVELCSDAVSPCPEPRAAVRAMCETLLAAATRKARPAGTVSGHAADAVLATAQLNRTAQAALSDGTIEPDERRELLQAVIEARSELDAVWSLLLSDGGAR